MNRPTFRVHFISYLAVLLLSVNTSVFGRPQTKKGVTLEDLGSLKQASYFNLSPAGDLLAYVLDGEIWTISTQYSDAPRKVAKGSVPVWSPDGQLLAYYSSESGTLQLWKLDSRSGRTVQVTNLPGGINPDINARMLGWFHDALHYGWSPDRRKLVFASQVSLGFEDVHSGKKPDSSPEGRRPQLEVPLVLTEKTPPDWTLGNVFVHGITVPHWFNGKITWDSSRGTPLSPRTVSQLFVVDIRSKTSEQLTKDGEIYFNPDWSPDGQRIVCASTEGRSLRGLGAGTTNIYVIEVGTGKKIAITTGSGEKRLPAWSPDGEWIAYIGGTHFGHQSVFLVPSVGGNSVNVTLKLQRSVQDFRWSSTGKSVFFSFTDGVSSRVARLDLPSGLIENISGHEDVYRPPIAISGSGTLSWQQSGPSSTGVIRVLPPGAGSSKILLDLNPQIKNWALGQQEVIRWENSQGDELEGILIKPVGYQAEHLYPLIVDGYPQQGNWFMGSAMYGNQAWASRGYVVFYPNARGPHVWMNAFKSETFDHAARGPKGWDVTVDDVMSGVDELISRRIVDPNRMGLYGFSNGAAVVNALVTRTDRFKCAVSVSPATSVDWSLPFFLDTANPLIPSVVGEMPWKAPYVYTDLSLIYQMDRVNTPILLADGDHAILQLLSSIEMYNCLRYLRKNVTLLRYPNQGHGFMGAALKDFSNRVNAFFDRYLKPQQPSN